MLKERLQIFLCQCLEHQSVLMSGSRGHAEAKVHLPGMPYGTSGCTLDEPDKMWGDMLFTFSRSVLLSGGGAVCGAGVLGVEGTAATRAGLRDHRPVAGLRLRATVRSRHASTLSLSPSPLSHLS